MTSEDVSDSVEKMLAELSKPVRNGWPVEQLKKQTNDQYQASMLMIKNDMNEMSSKMGFSGDMRDNETYQNTLDRIATEKSKYVDLNTKALQNISKIKTETTKVKRDLQNEQQQADDRLKTQHMRLERERDTFAMYHRLCCHMRLDSQHAGPEVRGVVSRAPTADITFSLHPDQLSAARLAERLWRLAAEHEERTAERAAEERPAERAEPRPVDGACPEEAVGPATDGARLADALGLMRV